ncbi:potassium channel family protein [Reichenbachiella versicolor]|uniref:potassium channel family protein n=1 Tax=Reichenbachiella versicolor TaxID=1821036 RepID=UPI000D6DFC06|nr:potassium channel family protein [Reichenbachiella versicolor]
MSRIKSYWQIAAVISISLIMNSLLVWFESSEEGASITDLSIAYWYLIVTLSTVGYGDYSPISFGGRIIGYIYVFSSLGVLGFLFSTITNKFRTYMEASKLGFNGTSFSQHVVFLGWDQFNQQVADEVISAGKRIAILTSRRDDVDLIYDLYDKKNVFVLFSDHKHTETYQRLNISEASVVFIAVEDDSIALKEVINLRSEHPTVSIVISLNEVQLKQTFLAAGVTYVISRNEIASKLVASYIFEPDVANLNLKLISSVGQMTDYDVQEYEALSTNPYLGKNGHEIFFELKKDHDSILMGISKKADTGWDLITNPSNEITLEEGNFLIIMTNGRGKKILSEVFNTAEGRS